MGISMNQPSLSVIIASRTQPLQLQFLERAIRSIEAQPGIGRYSVTIIIGVDEGEKSHLTSIEQRANLSIAESTCMHSQAAALNAAIRCVRSDLVAFLEDDDQWYPGFLANAERVITAGSGFVSSTQLEFDQFDTILRINDFPTASGWFMPFNTLTRIGEFNEAYRFHLDHEWLGRLSEAGIRRSHLVELTAPVNANLTRQIRPWLFNVTSHGGRFSELIRHNSPLPLVKRLVHGGSGMARISQDPRLREISTGEYEKLLGRFGAIPW
jgi:glycosyltransferase involved in cell wall biosynthesis